MAELTSRAMARAKRPRKRLGAPEALEEVLERAGENRFAKKKPPIPIAEWRAAVGPRIAERARPVALERGVLVVKVATSVWANELSMLAPELLARLRTRGFDATGLRFRVGPLDVDGPRQKKDYRKVPPPVPLGTELRASLDRVEDDELRSLIENAAASSLAWQEKPTGPIAAPRGARVPRDAGTRSAPRVRSEEGSGATSPRSSGGDGGRRR